MPNDFVHPKIMSKRRKTGSYDSLDVRKLARAGHLEPGAVGLWVWGNSHISSRARVVRCKGECVLVADLERVLARVEDKSKIGQWLGLTYSSCHFGGERPWWQCAQCDRRVALLYERSGSWACRHCHQLHYASQSERGHDRAIRQANKLRRRLGWQPGPALPPGDRPKGMHRRTFDHLVLRQQIYSEIALEHLCTWMERQRSSRR